LYKVIPLTSKPVKAFGTARYSPLDISLELKRLKVSHSIKVRSSIPNRVCSEKLVNCKVPQPSWVHLTDSTDYLRNDAINFISASFSELALTTISKLPPRDSLSESLTESLTVDFLAYIPEKQVLSPMDYVNIVAKPSLLNAIQTTVYKINPYQLRKDIQEMVLQFLNSQLSVGQMKATLKANLKLEPLIPMLIEAIPLREAVARLKTEPVETVALETGFPSFELMYVQKVRKKDK
jgi:hypothetical protein